MLKGQYQKVLNGRYFSVNESDFGDESEPIIIEITFNSLEDDDKAIFYSSDGLINPETDEVKIKFKAEFDYFGFLKKESYFIRKDREDLAEKDYKIKQFFPSQFKNYIPFYFVSTDRNIRDTISKKGDLFKIIRHHSPEHGQSISSFKKSLLKEIVELKILLKEIDFDWEDEDILKNSIKKEGIDKKDLETICDLEDKFSESHINEKISNILNILDNYSNAIKFDKLLKKINANLKDILQLENIENNIQNELSIISSNEFKLNTVLNQNNIIELFNMGFGEFSVFEQGEGYKNIMLLLIKLYSMLLAIENYDFNEERPYLIIFSLDEPELFLHPHLQRNLVKTLKQFQERFEELNVKLQVITSTHSPYILNPIKIDNLTIIKKYNNEFSIIKLYEEDFTNDKKLKRNLEILISNFSEIFFSRFIIMFEGESEVAALPVFAEKLDKDFDKYGVSLLNAKGVGNIQNFEKLINMLKIPNAILIDKDSVDDFSDNKNIFISGKNKKDAFEAEILNNVDFKIILQSLIELCSEDTNNDRLNDLKGKFEYIKYKNPETILKAYNHLKDDDYADFKKLLIKWLKKEKGIMFWGTTSHNIPKKQIPEVFKDLFKYYEKTISSD